MDWQIQQLAYNCGGYEWGTNEFLFENASLARSFNSVLKKMGFTTAVISMARGVSVLVRS
jgi:hypothetical protein